MMNRNIIDNKSNTHSPNNSVNDDMNGQTNLNNNNNYTSILNRNLQLESNNQYNTNSISRVNFFNQLSNESTPKVYCGNCGRIGHTYKKCNEPIISLGIILCNNLSNNSNNSNKYYNRYSNRNRYRSSYSYKKYDSEEYLNENKNDKILLVQRKDTIGYVEFMRGKYDVSNLKYINKLFELMTTKEKNRISEVYDFDKLRNLMGMNKNSRPYRSEYDIAKNKFIELKNKKDNFNLKNIIKNSVNIWEETEWGIPKGRRHIRESDKDCAIREFKEETGLTDNDFVLIENVKPLEEVYTGINGIIYKHIYFYAYSTNNCRPVVDPSNYIQTAEIGNIGWFNYKEAISKLRPYHREKINVVRKTFIMMRAKNKYFKEFSN